LESRFKTHHIRQNPVQKTKEEEDSTYNIYIANLPSNLQRKMPL